MLNLKSFEVSPTLIFKQSNNPFYLMKKKKASVKNKILLKYYLQCCL